MSAMTLWVAAVVLLAAAAAKLDALAPWAMPSTAPMAKAFCVNEDTGAGSHPNRALLTLLPALKALAPAELAPLVAVVNPPHVALPAVVATRVDVWPTRPAQVARAVQLLLSRSDLVPSLLMVTLTAVVGEVVGADGVTWKFRVRK